MKDDLFDQALQGILWATAITYTLMLCAFLWMNAK